MFKADQFLPWQKSLSGRRVFRFGRLRDECRPRLAGFGRVVPLRLLIGRGRDHDEMLAGRALDLAPAETVVALQMLLAVRARELELTHAGNVTGITAKLQTPKRQRLWMGRNSAFAPLLGGAELPLSPD